MGLFDFSVLSNPSSNAIFMAKLGVGKNCSGWVLYPRLVVLLDSSLCHQSVLPSKVQLTALCYHEGSSSMAGQLRPDPCMGAGGCYVSAYSGWFLSRIQFSRLPSILLSSYSYIKVQFLFCLGFSSCPHGNESPSHLDLNKKISCTWYFATCFFQLTVCHGHLTLWTQTGLPLIIEF